MPTTTDQIDLLRQRIARLEGHTLPRDGLAFSSGCAALDAILPEKGFRPGTLVEWLAHDEASGETSGETSGDASDAVIFSGVGAATLALLTAVQALRRAQAVGSLGVVVVLDPWGEFYPPAAVRWGVDPARLIVVHPASAADYHWAFDQALRCSTVAATIAWPDAVYQREGRAARVPLQQELPSKGLSSKQEWSQSRQGLPVGSPRWPAQNKTTVDGRIFRRLQIAAEGGRGLGLMIRSAQVRHEPSWADVRILVEPLSSAADRDAASKSSHRASLRASPRASRRLRVTVLRCRGGMRDRSAELEIPT